MTDTIPTMTVPSAALDDYAVQAWEIAARLRGGLSILGEIEDRDTSDEIQYVERLLRDALDRAEHLGAVAGDGHRLPVTSWRTEGNGPA